MEDLNHTFDYQNLWKVPSHDFKSLVLEVKTVHDILQVIGPALGYLHLLKLKVPIRDKVLWADDELKKF